MVDKTKSYWTFKDTSPNDYELDFHIQGHKKLKGDVFQHLFNTATGYVSQHKTMNPKGNLEYVEQFEIAETYYRLLEVNLRSEINRIVTEVELKFPIKIRSSKIIKGVVKREENGQDWQILIKLGGIYGKRI